jgi:hypothetical protein
MADQQQGPKDQYQRKKEQNKNRQQGGNQRRDRQPRGSGNDPAKNDEAAP